MLRCQVIPILDMEGVLVQWLRRSDDWDYLAGWLDAQPGVEEVRRMRYGCQVELAPHVVGAERFAARVVEALTQDPQAPEGPVGFTATLGAPVRWAESGELFGPSEEL